MDLKRRAMTALRKIDKPAVGAGLALAATYALTMALDLRARRKGPKRGSAGGPKASTAKASSVHPAAARSGWPFWKAVLIRVYEQVSEDRVLALAAGVVFYALLALFPAITALVSSYALFANPKTIGDHMNDLAGFMPAGAFGVVRDQVVRIIGHTTGGLSFAVLFGLGLAIWSANAGIKAIIDALNIAYGVKERRSFIVLNLVSLAFTIGAIAAMLLAFSAIVVLPVLISYLPFDGTATVLQWLRWPGLGVLLLLALAVLYRFGPDHVNARWHWITPGAVFAAVAWLAGSALLSWYLANFADYDATYGSLGAAIGLMMWMWMSAIVVLMGAELNAELDAAAASSDELAERSGL